jgi:hypothetical protein
VPIGSRPWISSRSGSTVVVTSTRVSTATTRLRRTRLSRGLWGRTVRSFSAGRAGTGWRPLSTSRCTGGADHACRLTDLLHLSRPFPPGRHLRPPRRLLRPVPPARLLLTPAARCIPGSTSTPVPERPRCARAGALPGLSGDTSEFSVPARGFRRRIHELEPKTPSGRFVGEISAVTGLDHVRNDTSKPRKYLPYPCALQHELRPPHNGYTFTWRDIVLPALTIF